MNTYSDAYHIPEQLPDEILYSRIIRFSLINSLSKNQALKLLTGKRKAILNIQLPSYIKKISAYGFGSCKEIIKKQTLYPYFNYLLPNQSKSIYKSMLNDKGGSTTKMSLLANINCNQNYKLKYCSCCIHQDINDYGVAYWHISHQIPFQILCPKHFVRLKMVSARTFNLPIPTEKNYLINYCSINLKSIGQLQKTISDILHSSKQKKYCSSEMISSELRNLGYKTKKGRYKRKKLLADIYKYYKDSIELLPFNKDNLQDVKFFDSIFHKSRKQSNHSPIKLLILINWIKNHNYCIPKKPKTYNRRSNETHKNRVIPSDISILESSIILEGITGKDRYEISKKLHIPVYKVESALGLFQGVISLRKSIWRYQRKIAYRFRVLTYLLNREKPSIKSLKNDLNKEYYWLYLYDKKWLINHQPKRITRTLFKQKRV
jgi:hypothetical protein